MKALLFYLLAGLAVFSSCGKDDPGTNDCQRLKGTWTANSWMEDNEQFFGDTIFITSSVLEFKELNGVQGDIEWNIGYTIGGDVTIIGSYVVNESCDEVIITPKSGSPTTYAFTIEGDELILDTHDNNVHVVQTYERNN